MYGISVHESEMKQYNHRGCPPLFNACLMQKQRCIYKGASYQSSNLMLLSSTELKHNQILSCAMECQ